jgi:hypothetical protein
LPNARGIELRSSKCQADKEDDMKKQGKIQKTITKFANGRNAKMYEGEEQY